MSEPIATTTQGQLKGITDTDLNGETYYKFMGIPYAKPPVGPLRFKAPQPAESWTGIRDATKAGSPCLSTNLLTFQNIGSEDCLYLNVYTKELPQEKVNPKPVMVFIHGGAFTMGTGGEEMAGAKYLVANDVVLVAMNYRLGLFGFLSIDDPSLDIPGNAGLKDQTLALKWVQENISSFNGDPNNVTIFGISAGGASVHFQVLSPTAKGLFHKAIAQSGTAFSPWAWGQKNVIQVAEKLGQKVSSEKDALDVLMKASGDELFQAAKQFPDVLLDATARRPFSPVIEKPNPTAFLTENPTDLLESGRFNQVPLIIGVTSNEGLLSEFKKAFDFDIDVRQKGVFWSFGLEKNSNEYENIRAKLNDFYYKAGKDPEDGKHEMVSDVAFVTGAVESVKLALQKSQYPIYFYVFSYEIALGHMMFKMMMGLEGNLKGVSHGGDSMFLLNSQLESQLPIEMNPDHIGELIAGVKAVTKIWTDFARSGRPHEQWEPVTDAKELKYFDIDKDCTLKVNPFAERMAFWDNLLKKAPKIDARLKENASV